MACAEKKTKLYNDNVQPLQLIQEGVLINEQSSPKENELNLKMMTQSSDDSAYNGFLSQSHYSYVIPENVLQETSLLQVNIALRDEVKSPGSIASDWSNVDWENSSSEDDKENTVPAPATLPSHDIEGSQTSEQSDVSGVLVGFSDISDDDNGWGRTKHYVPSGSSGSDRESGDDIYFEEEVSVSSRSSFDKLEDFPDMLDEKEHADTEDFHCIRCLKLAVTGLASVIMNWGILVISIVLVVSLTLSLWGRLRVCCRLICLMSLRKGGLL